MIDHLKALEFALEWAKHLTTLSAGTLVLSATFIKEVFKDQALRWNACLFWAWTTLFVSIVSGVFFIGSLCSQLDSLESKDLGLYAQPGVSFALLQNGAFLIGTALFAIYVFKNFSHKPTS
jgi:glucose uptake protein GlcU